MMTCVVCKEDYVPKNLARRAHSNFSKCDKCFMAKKAQSDIASANRKAQTEIMSLERRIEKLENTNEMLETIVESMVTEKVSNFIEASLSLAIKEETNKQLSKLQKQIIEVNNKYVRYFGVEDEWQE